MNEDDIEKLSDTFHKLMLTYPGIYEVTYMFKKQDDPPTTKEGIDDEKRLIINDIDDHIISVDEYPY